jgi:hypothetical protein
VACERHVNVPQLRIFKHHILVPKDLSTVTRVIDQVVEMVRQSLGVAGLLHVFEDFDDDGGVAVRVEVDFLVVGDLADLTFLVSDASGGGLGRERYLVSAKLEGRSTVIAPPKRGVVLNDIFFCQVGVAGLTVSTVIEKEGVVCYCFCMAWCADFICSCCADLVMLKFWFRYLGSDQASFRQHDKRLPSVQRTNFRRFDVD